MTAGLRRRALRAAGGAAELCGHVLDRSEPLQDLLNRRPRRLPAADDRIPTRVVDRRIVAQDDDVVQLTLRAADAGTALPRWHAGAHIDVHLPSGVRRQYSLCGDPDERDYRIAIRRIADGAGGSTEMHALQVDEQLLISTPRNAFYLALPGHGSQSTDVHFVAGGIGITPILPMLALSEKSGVPWRLVYTGRHRSSLAFLDHLAHYGDRVSVRTDDVHGLPTAEDLLAGVGPASAVYACGPAPMISVLRDRLPSGTTELHYERFTAAPVEGGAAFTVELARTGQTVAVGPEETALQAIRRLRPDIAYSCRQGFCGSCVQPVLRGEVDHRDQLLTDEQRRGQMLICVSRAAGDAITLDL